jgi:hypothetical protein
LEVRLEQPQGEIIWCACPTAKEGIEEAECLGSTCNVNEQTTEAVFLGIMVAFEN